MATVELSATSAYVDSDMPACEMRELAGGNVVVLSRRSPEKTTPNEDAAAVIPIDQGSVEFAEVSRAVLVVADGLGGAASGDHAARLAVEAMIRSLEPPAVLGEPLRTSILNGFDEANRNVLALGCGAATTLVVVEIQDGVIRPYHVGDSAILVTGQRGCIKLQSIAHSPVGYARESGLLDELEAMAHDERHLVSNVIGRPDMRIEVGAPLTLARRDTLLVATDGLFDNLQLGEIVERLRKGPLTVAVEELASAARQRMQEPSADGPSKPDDLTLVAFRLR